MFSHSSSSNLATTPGCNPCELSVILPQFDHRSLKVVRKAMSGKDEKNGFKSNGVSVAEFLKIVVLKAGAYDRTRVLDFLAGLVLR